MTMYIYKIFLYIRSTCLLLRVKLRSARGASHHPNFMGNCARAQIISRRFPIVLSTHWMKEMRCEFSPLPGVSVRIWNLED